MDFRLVPIEETDVDIYKKDMQKSFQVGAINGLGYIDCIILPEEDIDKSLNSEGAIAYKAMLGDEMVGGAIVVIDEQTHMNHLDFLYVKSDIQNKGIGQRIWNSIEQLHPDTKIWETVTPYFEKRNIHFYVNTCGFHIVEFYNEHHEDPNSNMDIIGHDYFFKLQKHMN